VKHDYARALRVLVDAGSRFSTNPGFVNNLAYVHLLLGNTQAARSLLEGEPIGSTRDEDVVLTATWGLLYLKEGNQEKARLLYRTAASLASQLGHKELAETVRQKMHLEFAKEALKIDATVAALKEVNLGLEVIKGGRPDYRADLVALRQKLTAR
jgi:hypothetical protein